MTEKAVLHTAPLYFHSEPMRERAMAVFIVVALHIAVATLWLVQSPAATMPQRGMEIAILAAPVVVHAEKLPVHAQPKIVPVQPQYADIPAPIPVPVGVAEQPQVNDVPVVIPPEPAPLAATAPVVNPVEPAESEIEPDFKATYLNNRLTYPLTARRMGIQGSVVLNVEVLAEGISGHVNVFESSGYEILDRAALESVKTWHFIPAHRAGLPITKWFKIPIHFSLKESEA